VKTLEREIEALAGFAVPHFRRADRPNFSKEPEAATGIPSQTPRNDPLRASAASASP